MLVRAAINGPSTMLRMVPLPIAFGDREEFPYCASVTSH